MSKPFYLTIAILLLSLIPWTNANSSEAIKRISQTELMQLLPSDADLKNIKRQQKAFKRGLYWTKNKTLKHLDSHIVMISQ